MKDTIYTNFLITRPILDDMELDHNFPIVKKSNILNYQNSKIHLTNFKNINSVIDKNQTIIDMFNYDNILNSIWNDPLKYAYKFSQFLAISTPDFSIYPKMSRMEIEHNIFKNRYIGSLYQHIGINVIPTISWGDSSTFDICFKGVEKGSAVIISTLGVTSNYDIFINGFNEMKEQIEPELIIVVGKLLPNMFGKFLVYKLNETFNPKLKNSQLSFFDLNNYIEIKK